ncbi:MAG: sigma 54-interacting transcriptional regulator, partial [Deltaproteobacteria bacterium]|nr:sigma 54-interacting transcriptional regulator [Deltaproteobacteria bacterium]
MPERVNGPSSPMPGENAEFLRGVLDHCFGSVAVTDAAGHVLFSNQSMADAFGLTKHGMEGRNIADIPEAAGVMPGLQEAVEKKCPTFGDFKSRPGVRMRYTCTPVLGACGELVQVVTWCAEKNLLVDFVSTQSSEHQRLRVFQEAISSYYAGKSGGRKIVVNSDIMRRLFLFLDNICNTDSSIILYGESGVGKDVLANYIHEKSARAKEPFIPINCGAIPHELMESEFFGYERGAFTGANCRGKPGVFELAGNGTLFLDEVAELSLSLQTKLLRVIESKEITRVGGVKKIKINAHLLAATNRDLGAMVDNGLFREDLFYRLNVIPVTVAPLRERKEDIEPLANLFLTEFNTKYSVNKRFSGELVTWLENAPWSGNVRELRNVIERMVITTTDSFLTLGHLDAVNSWRYRPYHGASGVY